MKSKMFLLLLLCMTQPAAATLPTEGQVTAQTEDGSWILGYDNKRYICRTTRLCRDFRVDMHFLTAFDLTREKELVDYMTKDWKWNDCIIHSCREY